MRAVTSVVRTAGFALFALLAVPTTADPAASPTALVKQTSERVLDILAENRQQIESDPDSLYELVSDTVLPHFDFARMSQWVLGKHWRRATETERQRFTNEFRTLLVRTYSTALLEYTGQDIEFLPLRGDVSEGDVTVRTEIRDPNSNAVIPIHYRMYRRDGEWKVYDVTIDGVSLVTNYRSSFSNQIRAQGIDGLIRQLAERNQPETPS